MSQRRHDGPRHTSEWIDLTGSIPRRSRRGVSHQAPRPRHFRERLGQALRQLRSERDLPAGLLLFVLVGLCAGTPVSLAFAVLWGRRSPWLTPIGVLVGTFVGYVSLLVLLSSLWVVRRGIRMLRQRTERRLRA
jgi:hypothetical protein